MDSSMEESVSDGISDGYSPPVAAPKAKPKAATAAPKATVKKALKTTEKAPKAAPKKLSQTTLSSKVKPAPSKKRPKPDTEDEAEASDQDLLNDGSHLSNTPPSAKKSKKASAPKPKKSTMAALQEIQNEAFDAEAAPKSKKSGKATDQYQKLTQLEHIIKRPDTYIGSVERSEKQMWVYNTEKDSMEMREVSFVPGLYKIFDEILVNAADNKQRDKNMDTIRVTVDREKGEISVYNNGRGIPIEIHEKENIYIPEMIFGHLLTSSNYDDEEEKVTGGRNGYGAKLCNIFSTEFILDTADSKTRQKYKQVWTHNMSKMGKASITSNKGDDYTKITFTPDFTKFKMQGMDDDFEALVKRRVYDLAGTSRGVKVWLNGERIKVNSFKKYMEMYTKAIKAERGEEAVNDASEIITESSDPRWEIGFAVSDGTFQQVSFVNSIATTSGGTHVNYIADQISNKLMDIVKKRSKKEGGAALKPTQVRNHIFIFVNSLIVNPAFTSQTKEQLTTKSSQFGSKCTVSDDFLKKIAKTEVVNNIMHFAQQKADQILKKSDGGRRNRMDNPKLTDANKAGTKDGYKCTLVLTEGDSAKGLAIAGRSVVSPDLFGVFPLRGKLLNVRDATVDAISKNSEIQNIKNFLGLKHKTSYQDCKALRYGHLMIMTDQDHDGSHIKGLLINFLQVQYPSLLQIPGFLIEFITPIVKVYKGDPKRPKQSQSFFTMPEYELWKEQHKEERGWEHKYYKGLGTSTTEDAQIYFQDLDKHLKEFHTMEDNEPELIELAFSKKKADERKEWLRQFKPGTYLDHSTRDVTYTDFINKELILFSMADNMRSIPSVVDGLKPGQRKVLFTCFKRNLKKDTKVVELAGSVSGLTAYQHGEGSLQSTIVGLAQTFVGSNNINCLEPSGNFGSRLQGGSDCASARYIYTRLSPFARKIFHPADEPLLTYNTDDERTIEPQTYVPVVPLVLINGADGIGTGWSSSIPNYNPEAIVENLKLMMDGKEINTMTPWFRDFKGTVTAMGQDRYKFSGIARQSGDNEIEITELPIRMWTQDFKDKLVEIIKAEKTPSFIKDYDDYNTHKDVHFVIRMEDKHMKIALDEGLEEKFKLTRSVATSNLVAFDAEGRITKYANVEDILKEFYHIRIKFYEKRKAYQLSEMQRELERFTNQARFVQMIIDGKLIVSKKKKLALVSELKKLGFRAFPKVADAVKEGELAPIADNDEEVEEDIDTGASAYDYLLGMPIWSLTQERVEKLLKQIGDKELEIDALIKLSKEDIWKRDLDDFIEEWRFQLEDDAKREKKIANRGRRASNKLRIRAAGPAGRKRKAKDEDSDDSDFGGVAPAKKAAPFKKAIKKEAPKDGLLAGLQPLAKANQVKEGAKPSKAAPKAVSKKAENIPKTGVNGIGKSVDDDPDDVPVAPIFKKAKAAAPASKPSASIKAPKSDEDSADEEIVRPAAGARQRRAAATKPVAYSLDDSDDSNGDGMLLNLGTMVKGIGNASHDSTSTTRPLFSTSASMTRPTSSAGMPKKSATASARQAMDADAEDDTDYAMLAPPPTDKKAVTARKTVLSDDSIGDDDAEEDSFIEPPPPAKKASATTVASKPSKPSAPATASSKAPVPKKAPAAAAKKTSNNTKATALAQEPKKLPLSPAAKAYAAKQQKARAQKMLLDNDDDGESDEDEVAKAANELLSDDVVMEDAREEEEEEEEVVGRRAARRAAVEAVGKTKGAYGDGDDDGEEEDEDSEEEEEEEEEDTAGFEDEGSSFD
ncbi:MAG: DNA topoisomerase 2 [Heterodermia speciosa]|uniref:DNA topoisomerase 2 n=1 Tax=Heterodermia speciosa TaxID=116794 RepID=A0A8H3I6G0_9LECA|nr:MAG: DNA topoisomerase 2 [Heterodermia speciosa]